MPKFKLDYGIYSSKDRLKAIESIDLSTLNQTELETVTNYILYGKDEDGTSSVDRKEIQIQTKFSSYNKNKCVSLDEMMENPSFDESQLQHTKTQYKKIKPQIDKEKAKTIPGMQDLWNSIDTMAAQLQALKQIENPTPEIRKEIYYKNHYLIQLRTQQYILMDSYFPTTQVQKNKFEYFPDPTESHMNYPVFPRGLMRNKVDQDFIEPRSTKNQHIEHEFYTEDYMEKWIQAKKPHIDFRNPDHIYELIQHYTELWDYVKSIPDSPINNLLWTLDFYIQKANLSEQQMLIIRDKKLRFPNKDIAQHLHDELGIYHQENYISTIWNKCTKLIVEAVELNYDEVLCKNYDKAWKVCNRCKQELLRDPRNFVRKTKALDGLTGRCKKCDKELRSKS